MYCFGCRGHRPDFEFGYKTNGVRKKFCAQCCDKQRQIAVKFKRENPFRKQFGRVLKSFRRRSKTEDRLALLIEYSNKVIYRRDPKTTRAGRENFETKKKPRIKLEGALCFSCGAPATCRHHVIQLQYGGGNRPHNIVKLCDQCHEKVHPWMAMKRFDKMAIDSISEAIK